MTNQSLIISALFVSQCLISVRSVQPLMIVHFLLSHIILHGISFSIFTNKVIGCLLTLPFFYFTGKEKSIWIVQGCRELIISFVIIIVKSRNISKLYFYSFCHRFQCTICFCNKCFFVFFTRLGKWTTRLLQLGYWK